MTRRRRLWLLGSASLVLLLVLAALDQTMQDTGGPGIVSFEFAGSRDEADRMLAEWGERGQDAARWSLRLDFLYLTLYGLFLREAALAARERFAASRMRRAGTLVAVCAVLASLSDAIEDVFLLRVLDSGAGDTAALLAAVFAGIKFALLAPVLPYVLAGLIAGGRRAPQPGG